MLTDEWDIHSFGVSKVDDIVGVTGVCQVVPDPDAAPVSIFRDQPGDADHIEFVDIAEITIIAIQEDPHRPATIVDEDRIQPDLAGDSAGDHTQPTLVLFQRGLIGGH